MLALLVDFMGYFLRGESASKDKIERRAHLHFQRIRKYLTKLRIVRARVVEAKVEIVLDLFQ